MFGNIYETNMMCIFFAVNPYKDKIDDEVVKQFYNDYWDVPDDEELKCGVPDKFTIECVKKYIWDNGNYTITKIYEIILLTVIFTIISSVLSTVLKMDIGITHAGYPS